MHVQHTVWYNSLSVPVQIQRERPSWDVWWRTYKLDINTRRSELSSSKLGCCPIEFNSTEIIFNYIWHFQWVAIYAKNLKKKWIHFKRVVFTAVAAVDLITSSLSYSRQQSRATTHMFPRKSGPHAQRQRICWPQARENGWWAAQEIMFSWHRSSLVGQCPMTLCYSQPKRSHQNVIKHD